MKPVLDPKTIEKEIKKRQQQRAATNLRFNLKDYLFPEQLRFVEDENPFKVAVCSRRSGKTVACAAHLIDTAIRFQGVVCLYVTLSRNNAKKIVWRELLNLNRSYELQGKTDLTELSITFPNGSVIYLSGAKDKSEIEKFRGLAIKLCYIDECQSFREYIEELIDDVISPALIDYAGTLCLIGTPGPIPSGYFHDAATNPSNTWSKHSWTFFDNPFITQKSGKTHQQMLDRELKRRGVTITNASIQREWFGKWVLDTESLWLHYDPSVNDLTGALPASQDWTFCMGVDLGFNDSDAICVLGWSNKDPVTYLIEECINPKQGITELVEQINEIRSRYNISKMVCDEGGLGKKLAEEIRRRHHIPLQPADKTRKMENAEFLNDAMRTQMFKGFRHSRFSQDCNLVEIDRDKSRPDKTILSDRYHSDIIDAVLYAFRESPAYACKANPSKPKPGTPDYYNEEISEMEQAAIDYFTAQEEAEKGYGGYK